MVEAIYATAEERDLKPVSPIYSQIFYPRQVKWFIFNSPAIFLSIDWIAKLYSSLSSQVLEEENNLSNGLHDQ